jgi:hypothetical protein
MSDEQKSYPVRYMPVQKFDDDGWLVYKILDTLVDDVAAICYSPKTAHLIAKVLNEAEGYVYRP